jgi:hypothetical protein
VDGRAPGRAAPRFQALPVRATVAPATGGIHTVFRIRLIPRETVGVRGHVIQGYDARLLNHHSVASCILDTGGFLNRPLQHAEIVLDPAKQMGLQWCRGTFTGRVNYYRDYACPAHGGCHVPAGFRRRSKRVARLRFEVR